MNISQAFYREQNYVLLAPNNIIDCSQLPLSLEAHAFESWFSAASTWSTPRCNYIISDNLGQNHLPKSSWSKGAPSLKRAIFLCFFSFFLSIIFFLWGLRVSVIFHLFVWDRINEKVISPSPRNEALIAQRPTRASFPSLSFLGCGGRVWGGRRS